MTALIIVESPAKIKTISKILGPNYVIRATVGHIIDLAKGKGGDLGIDILNGFKPRYEVLPDKKDKIKAIVDAAKSVDIIYVASDPDREGEAIAFHIANQLKHLNKPIKRIEFNQITKKVIENAVENPRDFDQNLFDAQQARRVLDRIVGFMVSPFISKKLNDKLSAGRVQSVVLRMIVDRDREISSFVPDVYYNINATLSKTQDKADCFVAKFQQRVENEQEAIKIKEDLDKSTYEIFDIQTKPTPRKANPPLTTSALLQEASTKLKFKADRTTKAAQSLYEGGHITYIRTDAVRNSEESIIEVRKYITSSGFSIPKSPNEYQNKDGAQDAHEAIRPTHVDMLPEKIPVETDQQKVYELIWRMFVASQMEPAIFEVVKVSIKASSGHHLVAEGKILREEGWMSVMKPLLKKDKDVILPILNTKDKLSLVTPKVKMEKSQTKPPARYSEASLIAELERKEIGRPSTYASTISRIATRRYVKDTPNGLVPTDLGFTVIDNLKDSFSFMDYLYTANMEKKLDEIAHGKLEYIPMMTEFFEGFKNEFQKARGEQGMNAGIKCPKCGSDMVVRKSKYGFFAGCVRYKGGCDGIVSILVEDGKVLEKEHKAKVDDSIKCPDCGSGMVYRPDGRFGPFYSCSNYPKCYGKRKIPFGKTCSKCGNELYATLFNGNLKLACMGYPNCKNIEDIPSGSNVDWLDPEKITPPTYDKKVEKVLLKY
jgi:DNA topoisomerase-1